ncbi:MAG TPA: hypothetical protein VFJ96_07440 [Gemmatimonadaceae bacterium]|nr:hypothetical protein [Gemmatimonadaceae bacterium]
MRPDIIPGATFPDYALPDETDMLRRLSVLQGDDPMVLTLHRDLREISANVRPDWHIDSSAMREKREAGEREKFYPYGQSMHQVLVRAAGAVDQFE